MASLSPGPEEIGRSLVTLPEYYKLVKKIRPIPVSGSPWPPKMFRWKPGCMMLTLEILTKKPPWPMSLPKINRVAGKLPALQPDHSRRNWEMAAS